MAWPCWRSGRRPRGWVELGHTPTSFEVANVTAALRYRIDTPGGPWSFGLERTAVGDSLLSLGGVVDPLTGLDWGGVTRNRAYLGGSAGNADMNVYGRAAGALLDGQRVDDNSQWEAEAGFWRRAASGQVWKARWRRGTARARAPQRVPGPGVRALVESDPRFEIVVPPPLSLVCFRLRGTDETNQELLERLNRSGRLYLTHTRLDGRIVLRFCVGQPHTEERHVREAWQRIQAEAALLAPSC